MSSSNQRPAIEDSVQFSDAPYPIIAIPFPVCTRTPLQRDRGEGASGYDVRFQAFELQDEQ